jgi:glycosyltransferase involved in cell wall biosynthesis
VNERLPKRSLRFLFVGAGYPGVPGTGSGSGIGTYVRELALGLTARGHQCHALVWSEDGSSGEHEVEGVRVTLVRKQHWPIVERWWPDARNEWNRGRIAAALDGRWHFDRVEIQSDEGVDIQIQRRFAGRTILRVHTTLHQMCKYKEVTPNHLTPTWLARERRSICLADKVIVSSELHSQEFVALFPGSACPRIVPLGYECAAAIAPDNLAKRDDHARFLTIGTFDRRKGTDRLRDVATSYAQKYGPCELRLVSSSPESALSESYGLRPPYPPGVSIRYLTRLSSEELKDEYRKAAAYLHLARYESFGYPLIEAASQGTPVVATPTGIAPELLVDSLRKLLICGDDPGDFASALHLARQSRTEFGAQMYERYAAGFTRDHMTEKYLEVLAGWHMPAVSSQSAVSVG